MNKTLKNLGLFVLITVGSCAILSFYITYDLGPIKEDVKKAHDSFKVGSPIYDFYFPEDRIVLLSYRNTEPSGDKYYIYISTDRDGPIKIRTPREEPVTDDNYHLDSTETIEGVPGYNGGIIKTYLKANIANLSRCNEMTFTTYTRPIGELKRYKFKVTYKGETVTSVGDYWGEG